jgi:branched-chain amino acid transport system substrate-binding protein
MTALTRPEAAASPAQALMEGGGTYYSTVAGPAKLYPGTAKFQTDFKAKYNADPKPFAAQGYDSMGICLKAIENAAKANGKKLPDPPAGCRSRARPERLPGHHRHDQLQQQGRPGPSAVLHHPGNFADPAKWNDNTIARR